MTERERERERGNDRGAREVEREEEREKETDRQTGDRATHVSTGLSFQIRRGYCKGLIRKTQVSYYRPLFFLDYRPLFL